MSLPYVVKIVPMPLSTNGCGDCILSHDDYNCAGIWPSGFNECDYTHHYRLVHSLGDQPLSEEELEELYNDHKRQHNIPL